MSKWMGNRLVKHKADRETRLFIPHYSIVAHYSSLERVERFLSAPFTVALRNWNPGNRGPVVRCLRTLPDSHPFPKWEGAPRPPAEPLGEKSPSSHSAWSSEVSGLLPKHTSEDCSFSVRTVSLPDCVAMETKLLYALKSKYFLRPHARLTPQSKLGRMQSIKTIQTHSFLFSSLALDSCVFKTLTG